MTGRQHEFTTSGVLREKQILDHACRDCGLEHRSEVKFIFIKGQGQVPMCGPCGRKRRDSSIRGPRTPAGTTLKANQAP